MLKHLIPAPKKMDVLEGTLKIKSAIYTEHHTSDTTSIYLSSGLGSSNKDKNSAK